MNFNNASKYSLISLAALALILMPNLAHAYNTPITGGHMHSVAFHDRTPHVHDRTPVAHH